MVNREEATLLHNKRQKEAAGSNRSGGGAHSSYGSTGELLGLGVCCRCGRRGQRRFESTWWNGNAETADGLILYRPVPDLLWVRGRKERETWVRKAGTECGTGAPDKSIRLGPCVPTRAQ